jgi:methyltransferase (TIGR00027 family)
MRLGPSFSGLATAANRAIESYVPERQRLFDDHFTLKLLPTVWQVALKVLLLPGPRDIFLAWRERQAPGVLGNLQCRTRYIDEALCRALKRRVEQVVILGAGFDSRAYRIPGIQYTRVFEVELPGSQRLKRARLEKILGTLPSHVVFVPIDFERQKLEEPMRASGFRAGVKTFYIWEGVTQYITAEAVDATFRYISEVGASGSEVVFTYVLREIVDGTSRSEVQQRVVSFIERLGSPWVFGFDPVELEGYLAVRGLKVIEEVGAREYQARYLHPIGRETDIFEGEEVVRASVVGAAAA